jgi:hypothetical protein
MSKLDIEKHLKKKIQHCVSVSTFKRIKIAPAIFPVRSPLSQVLKFQLTPIKAPTRNK